MVRFLVGIEATEPDNIRRSPGSSGVQGPPPNDCQEASLVQDVVLGDPWSP